MQASAKTTDKRNVRNVRNTLCCLSAIVLCVAIVPSMEFEFTGPFKFVVFRFNLQNE